MLDRGNYHSPVLRRDIPLCLFVQWCCLLTVQISAYSNFAVPFRSCCCPGCSSPIKLWQNDSLKRNATGCWTASPVSKSLCHWNVTWCFHFRQEFHPAAFGLFTHVCRHINTLVCLHINSNMAEAACGAETPTILKKRKQILNVIMDVVKIKNRSK